MLCYHLTNQNVFEGSSMGLSDLLLINAVPLWDSVYAEKLKKKPDTEQPNSASCRDTKQCTHNINVILKGDTTTQAVGQKTEHKSYISFNLPIDFLSSYIKPRVVGMVRCSQPAKNNVFWNCQDLSIATHCASTMTFYLTISACWSCTELCKAGPLLLFSTA